MHDEFETVRTSDRVPADDLVSVLEVPCGGAPNQHRHHFAFLHDELAESLTGLATGPEEMLFVEHLMSDFPVRRRGGKTDV